MTLKDKHRRNDLDKQEHNSCPCEINGNFKAYYKIINFQ